MAKTAIQSHLGDTFYLLTFQHRVEIEDPFTNLQHYSPSGRTDSMHHPSQDLAQCLLQTVIIIRLAAAAMAILFKRTLFSFRSQLT